MTSRRVLKAAEAIREVVSMAILTDLRDPRIQNVTVTFVEVSGDMRLAKVKVSVMGDEAQQELSLKGLQNAAGFLQQKVGDRVDSRYIPKLRFELDRGVKHALEVDRILKEVLPAEKVTTEDTNDSVDDDSVDDDSVDDETDGTDEMDGIDEATPNPPDGNAPPTSPPEST